MRAIEEKGDLNQVPCKDFKLLTVVQSRFGDMSDVDILAEAADEVECCFSFVCFLIDLLGVSSFLGSGSFRFFDKIFSHPGRRAFFLLSRDLVWNK